MAAGKDKSGQGGPGDTSARETLETLLGKLEAVVSDLEGGETELEQSLSLYEKGMALVNLCNQRLDTV
ncbi:MAG: exodeoxyribonuclease VII small subunit, partial [Gemmataceae bacterium]